LSRSPTEESAISHVRRMRCRDMLFPASMAFRTSLRESKPVALYASAPMANRAWHCYELWRRRRWRWRRLGVGMRRLRRGMRRLTVKSHAFLGHWRRVRRLGRGVRLAVEAHALRGRWWRLLYRLAGRFNAVRPFANHFWHVGKNGCGPKGAGCGAEGAYEMFSIHDLSFNEF